VDEATRTGGEAVGNGKRGPEEIRADIEHTREELGDTVEALAAKTDIKAQAKAKVQHTKEHARAAVESKVEAVKEHLPGSHGVAAEPVAGPGVHSIGSVPVDGRVDATHRLRSDPKIYAVVGAVAAGLLLVSLLRSR